MLSTCLYITASSFQDLFCQHFLHCLLGIEGMPRYKKKIHKLDNSMFTILGDFTNKLFICSGLLSVSATDILYDQKTWYRHVLRRYKQ